jgi:CBS domain-containing protein
MREVPRIDSTADAFETLALLGQSGASTALVVNGGRITGVLSETDYAHALTIQRGFRSNIPG